ncbi:zinc-binding alcohol dehydrogenase family protein [Andreprevotia lacus DSM 23236]|jgi:alcohol dehydrogenase|uniref:Zinc-type alcohol dehydrogenase-like protein n=1 Tax=Andreprevotia lacus DSM 23236 TaxID=1121001 RepID=A0A1W1X4D6_9NEIS|nr:zinc-binding alcohol dehydrogenase family protein [Andreprevotia lacus]SMC18683.1 zinc-binding alcohol dehydrogenase family protein [Andreprevotia lacus DSM 23236]
MKAVALTHYLPIDNPDALLDVVLPKPEASGRDLLVKIEAIAVNPVDTKVRSPKAKFELTPRVLGWDAAGVVEAVGPEVTLFKPGDAVYYAGDITRPGSNAEYQLVDERIVGHKPASLDFAGAAALPLTAITAWEALFDRLRVGKSGADAGKTVLIVGGAGGVGSIAIQLAKQLAGLTVIATAARAESQAWVKQLGADATVDHRQDLVAQVRSLGHQYVDYILCFNNTDQHFAALAELIAPQSTIVTIVENARPVPVELLKSKSALYSQEFMFTRSMFQTADMIEQHRLLNEVAKLVDAGTLRSTVGEHYGAINAANLRRAHATLEAGQTIGKIVLECF